MSRLAAALLCLAFAPALSARIDLLLVPPAEAVTGEPGLRLVLYLNNPSPLAEDFKVTRYLHALYTSQTGHGRVLLEVVGLPDDEKTLNVPAASRRDLTLELKERIVSPANFVSLRLEYPETNPIMFEVRPAPAAPPTPLLPPATPRAIDLSSDLESTGRHIAAYEPIYFAVGWRDRFNARFQISFKYRVFERGPPDEAVPLRLARDLHLAYTQTSIWDLESFSKPFYDSSYKPTVFFLHEVPEGVLASVQYGAQHESNGKGGGSAAASGTGLVSPSTALRHPSDSRSLNSLYLAPTFRWKSSASDYFVELRPRVIAYFHATENADLARFRGHVELGARAGLDHGWQLAALLRGSVRGHGSAEFNLTWPTDHVPLLPRTLLTSVGGYLQVQYFNGYGESLLDYDVRRRDQLRFGFTLVR